jgi:hypothetical protein
MKSGKWKGKEK